jgi:hypothetical protein
VTRRRLTLCVTRHRETVTRRTTPIGRAAQRPGRSAEQIRLGGQKPQRVQRRVGVDDFDPLQTVQTQTDIVVRGADTAVRSRRSTTDPVRDVGTVQVNTGEIHAPLLKVSECGMPGSMQWSAPTENGCGPARPGRSLG